MLLRDVPVCLLNQQNSNCESQHSAGMRQIGSYKKARFLKLEIKAYNNSIAARTFTVWLIVKEV
jgi:hypothetical protein